MSMSEQLSQAERTKFARWLRESAETDAKMAEQLALIGQEVMAKTYRIEAMAASVIAAKLEDTESVTI